MNILVADDHALVRLGLIEALKQLCDAEIRFTEAEDAEQVLGVIASGVHLDLILLDLFMPGANGFELLSRVCELGQETPVVVMSASDSAADVRKALDCGASGFIPKSTPQELTLTALRLVLAGGVYVPSELVRATSVNPPEAGDEPAAVGMHLTSGDETAPAASVTGGLREEDAGLTKLTARQRQVLALISRGLSNKRIARALGLSEFTVKAHVAAILRVLGVGNRVEAAARARRMGLGE
jgi:DNA-binding NarL/FixJ family response regulator